MPLSDAHACETLYPLLPCWNLELLPLIEMHYKNSAKFLRFPLLPLTFPLIDKLSICRRRSAAVETGMPHFPTRRKRLCSVEKSVNGWHEYNLCPFFTLFASLEKKVELLVPRTNRKIAFNDQRILEPHISHVVDRRRGKPYLTQAIRI